jgi:pimeloyl-ACP methyl ester carboxylesterase
MFRNLITALADDLHLVAPDYPGFGNSSMPTVEQFGYTFDHLAEVIEKFTEKVGLKKYSLYVQDYGAPVGYRLAVKHPERVQALVVQNGNAYDEGEVVPASTLMARVREVATRLAAKPQLAVRCIIDCVRQAGYLTLEQGLDLETKCYAICCTSPDVIQGLEAFLEKKRKR